MARGLEIRLLGDLAVVRDGAARALPHSKKARAMLAYLVTTARPHSRERLCDLLWDGPDDPRGGLRWALSRLRAAVDEPRVRRLAATRAEVAFEPRGAEVDLFRARRLVGEDPERAPLEALRNAAALFRGEFLEGLDLTSCYRFHEWCTGEREAARRTRIRILSALVARLQATAPEEALAHARARVFCDPTSEQAHAEVMSLLGALGRPREALEQYDACRRILSAALGARPQGAIERARAALSRGAPAAPEPSAEPAARPTPVRLPLVGRRKEVARLERAVAAPEAGPRGLFLVLGEAGLGKTRILEELAGHVQAKGGLVLSGRAFEAEMVRPFGAWIDAFRAPTVAEAAAPWRDVLAPLIPALGAPESAGDRDRLFAAVSRLLPALGTSRPVVVILDDLHWIDEASAALLHAVARAGGGGVVLAGAARPGELGDNPAALRLHRGLGRAGLLRELRLQPLDEAETQRLVSAVDPRLDGPRVFAESQGNPLFALEVAQALRRGEEPSATLDDLIADRLGRLDARCRELVPWAAAFGGTFGPDLLARATGFRPGDVLAALGELEGHGVVHLVRGEGAGYDFVHDLVRRVAYLRLSGPQRELVHLQIARALAATHDPDGARAGELAHHAALGGDHGVAARSCLAAGRRAARLFAFHEAADLAERGIRHAAKLPPAERIPLELDLLTVHVQPGLVGERAHQVQARISRLVLEAQSAGLQDVATRGFWLLSIAHHAEGDDARAHEVSLRAAESAHGSGSAAAAEALAGVGRCLIQLEREVSRAELLLREAQAIGARERFPVIDVELGFGFLHAFDGREDLAVPHLSAGLAMVRREPDHWREFEILARFTTLALEAGRFEETLAHGRKLSRAAEKLNEGSEAPFAAGLEALARLGLDEDAEAALARAVERLRGLDASARLAYVLAAAAALALDRGEPVQASCRAEAALAAAVRGGRTGQVVAARSLLCRAATARGDAEGAARELAAARGAMGDPRDAGAYATRLLAAAEAALVSTRIPIAPGGTHDASHR